MITKVWIVWNWSDLIEIYDNPEAAEERRAAEDKKATPYSGLGITEHEVLRK